MSEPSDVCSSSLSLDLTETEAGSNGKHPDSENLEEIVVDLYKRLRPALVSYVYRLIGSTNDAEDMVQVAFIKLIDQLERRVFIINLRSWLYRVVHNLAISHATRISKYESLMQESLAAHEAHSETASFDCESVKREIDRGFGVLNERERACLMMRAEGLSYKEIAAALSISTKAVSVYLVRGLKKFEKNNGNGHRNSNGH